MDDTVFIPVSRGRALTRFVLWAVPTALCTAITLTVYPALDYSSTALPNRLVTISIVIVLLPAPIAALVCGIKAIRYLVLTLWPRSVGVLADAGSLRMHLGPFGTKNYDAARLDIRYPFELSTDEDEVPFEALMPEERQFEQFLPRIRHPNAVGSINRLILHHCIGDEIALAQRLRPMIQTWRSLPGVSTSGETKEMAS